MATLLKIRIGWLNVAGIVLIGIVIGFGSIFSLASAEQAREWHQHLVTIFTGRVLILMCISCILTAVLILANIIYDLIVSRHIVWQRQLAITLWSLLLSFIVAITGSIVLLS